MCFVFVRIMNDCFTGYVCTLVRCVNEVKFSNGICHVPEKKGKTKCHIREVLWYFRRMNVLTRMLTGSRLALSSCLLVLGTEDCAQTSVTRIFRCIDTSSSVVFVWLSIGFFWCEERLSNDRKNHSLRVCFMSAFHFFHKDCTTHLDNFDI